MNHPHPTAPCGFHVEPGDGCDEEAIDILHAWLIEDLPGGRVRVLTQESQFGQPARKIPRAMPNPMVNAHQDGLEGQVAVTARVALFTHGNLKPGETVLLQGSGGVSLFALQLVVAHSARVFVTSRSPGKVARLKQLGAGEVIDTSANAAWDEAVLRLTDGRGFGRPGG